MALAPPYGQQQQRPLVRHRSTPRLTPRSVTDPLAYGGVFDFPFPAQQSQTHAYANDIYYAQQPLPLRPRQHQYPQHAPLPHARVHVQKRGRGDPEIIWPRASRSRSHPKRLVRANTTPASNEPGAAGDSEEGLGYAPEGEFAGGRGQQMAHYTASGNTEPFSSPTRMYAMTPETWTAADGHSFNDQDLDFPSAEAVHRSRSRYHRNPKPNAAQVAPTMPSPSMEASSDMHPEPVSASTQSGQSQGNEQDEPEGIAPDKTLRHENENDSGPTEGDPPTPNIAGALLFQNSVRALQALDPPPEPRDPGLAETRDSNSTGKRDSAQMEKRNSSPAEFHDCDPPELRDSPPADLSVSPQVSMHDAPTAKLNDSPSTEVRNRPPAEAHDSGFAEVRDIGQAEMRDSGFSGLQPSQSRYRGTRQRDGPISPEFSSEASAEAHAIAVIRSRSGYRNRPQYSPRSKYSDRGVVHRTDHQTPFPLPPHAPAPLTKEALQQLPDDTEPLPVAIQRQRSEPRQRAGDRQIRRETDYADQMQDKVKPPVDNMDVERSRRIRENVQVEIENAKRAKAAEEMQIAAKKREEEERKAREVLERHNAQEALLLQAQRERTKQAEAKQAASSSEVSPPQVPAKNSPNDLTKHHRTESLSELDGGATRIATSPPLPPPPPAAVPEENNSRSRTSFSLFRRRRHTETEAPKPQNLASQKSVRRPGASDAQTDSQARAPRIVAPISAANAGERVSDTK